MKLQNIKYNENENIENLTVIMSFNEAVALANIAGKLNGHACRKLNFVGTESLYDCVASALNTHLEDGYPDLDVDLNTINDKP